MNMLNESFLEFYMTVLAQSAIVVDEIAATLVHAVNFG